MKPDTNASSALDVRLTLATDKVTLVSNRRQCCIVTTTGIRTIVKVNGNIVTSLHVTSLEVNQVSELGRIHCK